MEVGAGLISVEFTKLSQNARWANAQSDTHRTGVYQPMDTGKNDKNFLQYVARAVWQRRVMSSLSATLVDSRLATEESRKTVEKVNQTTREAIEETRQATSTQQRVLSYAFVGLIVALLALFYNVFRVVSSAQSTVAPVAQAYHERIDSTVNSHLEKNATRFVDSSLSVREEVIVDSMDVQRKNILAIEDSLSRQRGRLDSLEKKIQMLLASQANRKQTAP